MAGKSRDPKPSRITVRLGDGDLRALLSEARRRNVTVGAVVRDMIRTQLINGASPGRRSVKGS